jgi:hypothetical protein
VPGDKNGPMGVRTPGELRGMKARKEGNKT